MWREFKAFLVKQNAIALAIAVVLGVALNALVQSIVNDFIMPIVTVFEPAGAWQTAVFTLGPFKFGYGHFLSTLLNFLVIGFVCWRISKLFTKPEPASAPATKPCPYCRMQIDAEASRCPHCTSQLAVAAVA
jgi:large conductance mechanosensitive channel